GLPAEEFILAALDALVHFADSGRQAQTKLDVQFFSGEVVLSCAASDPGAYGFDHFDYIVEDGATRRVRSSSIPPVRRRAVERLACERLTWISAEDQCRDFDQAGLTYAVQASILRDVVRAPFRPLFFRMSRREFTQRIAEVMYNSGALDAMPVLADALEES